MFAPPPGGVTVRLQLTVSLVVAGSFQYQLAVLAVAEPAPPSKYEAWRLGGDPGVKFCQSWNVVPEMDQSYETIVYPAPVNTSVFAIWAVHCWPTSMSICVPVGCGVYPVSFRYIGDEFVVNCAVTPVPAPVYVSVVVPDTLKSGPVAVYESPVGETVQLAR